MEKRNPIDLSNGMKSFNEDVLILCGDKDNVSLPYAKSIAQSYPKNQLILIPNTKFFPWEDNPSFFYKSINNFMADKKN